MSSGNTWEGFWGRNHRGDAVKIEPEPGTRVLVPWGLDAEIQAEVDYVYGPPDRRHVLLWLDPEYSGETVTERVTISMPLDAVTVISSAA
jgi:hypothetical protein